MDKNKKQEEEIKTLKIKKEENDIYIKELLAIIEKLKKENKELKEFKDKFNKDKTLKRWQIDMIKDLVEDEEHYLIREIAGISETSIGTVYRVKNGEIRLEDYPK